MIIFEYADQRGTRVRDSFGQWLDSLPPQAKAKIEARITQARDITFDEAVARRLFVGPLSYQGGKFPGIFKMQLNAAGMALRPLLCRGPMDEAAEATLLVGAREQNYVLAPDPAVAVERRQRIVDQPRLFRRPLE